MQRREQLQRLQREEFDLCIIGAGASGAGAALDASLRGLKVALVERDDFAAGTSSRSTKLIHGGVRYLEQAFKSLDWSQLKQVRHGLEERHIVLRNAPNLAHPLAIITPVYRLWEAVYYYIGLKIYGFFASRKDPLPGSRFLGKTALRQLIPGISSNIRGGVLYYDGQLNDARYALALVQSATAQGAAVCNHLEVIEFQKDISGKINSAIVQDVETHHRFGIRARHFLNCCGPFSDAVRQLANPGLPERITPSKGVHIMLPLEVLGGEHAVLIPKTRDGRVIFAIPFEGRLLLGTTDEPYPDVQHEPMLESDEVDFLLETLQPYVEQPIDKKKVRAGFGGIRPLVKPSRRKEKATKSLLRDHEVEYDENSGLVSLLGGKWTTYRLMAKDAVDFICSRMGNIHECTTQSHVLYGSEGWTPELAAELHREFGLGIAECTHLSRQYGIHAREVCEIAKSYPEGHNRLAPPYPFLVAEVIYAARKEMALDLRDVLARRIRLEILDWPAARQAAPVAADWMARELSWTDAKKAAVLTDYLKLIDKFEKESGAFEPERK